MKRKFVFITVLFFGLILSVHSQDTEKFGIDFNGFVKSDLFYDSRQVETIREGHFLLYPLNVSYDKDSIEDINAIPSMNLLSIQTRLTGNISAPDALRAKTSGMIEAEFFGTSNADINGLRLRHAYVKLNWKKSELLIGQTWHPMFNADCYPEVVSFNTGAPFQPFARNPQIRYSWSYSNLKFVAVALAQRDFVSPGPDGNNSKYLRNAALPEVNGQLIYKKKNSTNEKDKIIAGIGAGYKILRPRVLSDSSYKTNETVESASINVFVKYCSKYLTWKIEGVYGQNLYDLTMLGGYAVRYDTTADMNDKDFRTYTTMDVVSAWTELMTNGKKIQLGLFGGFSKNMGSLHNIYDWTNSDYYYMRGRDIDYLYRISPRVIYNSGKLRLGLEGEYTTAVYGTAVNSLGEVYDGDVSDGAKNSLNEVSNIRILLGVYYFF